MARSARLAAVVAALAAAAPARAHEFKLESVVPAFARIEGTEAHLVVRVPLHALHGVRFPLRNREIVNADAGPGVREALALVAEGFTLTEDGRPLAPSSALARLSLPSDRSFETYDGAVAHVARANEDVVFADQGYLDAHLTYPIRSAASRYALRTTLAPELGNLLRLALRYQPPGGSERAMVITRDQGAVALNPTWARAASGFAVLGVEHILGGLDHLLFLLCLVVPLVRLRQVVSIVTAFTVAHSFTLLGSAYGLAPSGPWFPPFVETTIAASIVYMAIENVLGTDLRRRWLATALFGLVHGFGFSYGLQQNLQFAGDHLLVSLFAFNAGIELGQLAVVAAILPVLALVRRRAGAQRSVVLVLSALVAHTAWHWMIERGDVLWKTEWPRLDGASVAALARWLALALVAGALLRILARRASAALPRLLRRRAPTVAADGTTSRA